MTKIDTSRWKSFRIGDLFETEKVGQKIQVPTGGRIAQKNLKVGTTPRITVSGINNGITGYYTDIDDKNYRIYQNFISVSFLGTVFYQAGVASLDMKVHCLKPLNIELNEHIASFLVTTVKATLGNIEYSDQISSSVLPGLEILLPVDASGEPDWVYMDAYMSAIMKESKTSLENLTQTNGEKHVVDVTKWGEFVIGKLFPSIVKPPVLHARQVIETNEGIPYVVRTKFNNGIKCRVHPVNDVIPSPAGVITWGAENATFFYQTEEFLSGRDIYFIDTRPYSANTCLFLTACLQTITHKYPYNYGLFPDLLKEERIKLPVDASGEPDWAYMDKYMQAVLNNTQTNLSAMQAIESK